MIDESIANDPRYAEAMEEFKNSVRMYWRRNVEAYFDLRTGQAWAQKRKMDHRISISTGGEKRLRNALEIKWNPETGHTTVMPGRLMVKGGTHAWDLITILQMGTRASPKAYIAHLKEGMGARVNWGERGPQSNAQWVAWMNKFIPYVDRKLEELADSIAEIVADSIEDEIAPEQVKQPEEF